MKSKTSFFSKTLFFNTIKRFWPLFAAYLLIWLIILPLSLNGILSWGLENYENDLSILAAEKVLTQGAVYATIMASAFGLFFAMAAFSYLYSPRSVSMICALPNKRESIFVSQLSTGLAAMFVSNIIVFLITILVESSYGILDMSYLWQWLGIVSLNCLFFYGFAVFCASLTGNILVLPCVYLVLNFTVVVVEIFARAILSGVYYGISSTTAPVLGFMSPIYELLLNKHVTEIGNNAADGAYRAIGYEFQGWPTLIIYGALGAIFVVLALLLVKHRRMETAGDVVAVAPLKPIFKYCMAFGCALVLGVVMNSTIFYNSNNYLGYGSIAILLVCMLFGAFIGYFAAEMLMQKTLKVFAGKTWVGFGISCLVIIVLMLSCEFDIFGFERNIPEAEEVASVSIHGSFDGITLENPENIQSVIDLHKSVVDNKAIYENYRENIGTGTDVYLHPDYNGSSSYADNEPLSIDYSLKNGKMLSRHYILYYDATDDCATLNDIINCREAVDYRKLLDIPVTEENFSMGYIRYLDTATGEYQNYDLSSEEAVKLYNDCIVPDIEAGSMGNVWLSTEHSKVNGRAYFSTVYDCEIYIELLQRKGEVDYRYDSSRTYLTVDAENTLAWFEKQDIKPSMMGVGPVSDKAGDTKAA